MEYRLNITYAKSDPSSPNPRFHSLEEWATMKSTKMDTCAQICSHYLHHDDVSDVTFVDGRAVFEDVEPFTPGLHTRNRKILIFSEFPSMTAILRNVRCQHSRQQTIHLHVRSRSLTFIKFKVSPLTEQCPMKSEQRLYLIFIDQTVLES